MSKTLADYQAEVRYLLHRMDSEERESFAERLWTDPELFDRVLHAENELFDLHAIGRLPPGYQLDFERRLLATRGQWRKLATARALASRPRAWTGGWLAIAAGVVLLAVLAPILARKLSPTKSTVAVVMLPGAQTRVGTQVPEYSVPKALEVELRMPVDPGDALGEVRVSLVGGGGEIANAALRAVGSEIRWRLESGRLPSGRYELSIRDGGGTLVGFVEFRLARGAVQ
jgi:hypothetical protein